MSSNIDLEKFPASKVRQLAKKMESSKSTARHIKQVTSNPQAAQVNLYETSKNKPPTKQEQVETTFPSSPDQRVRRGTQVNTQESKTTLQAKI